MLLSGKENLKKICGLLRPFLASRFRARTELSALLLTGYLTSPFPYLTGQCEAQNKKHLFHTVASTGDPKC